MASQRKREGRSGGAKDPELVAFGQRVFELREAAGMTQEELARAAGLHWTYIGQIERGERNLSYKNVRKLAKGLGIDASKLLRGLG
jgi:transcriptional regulator with XRE-family HTH domain